MRGDIRLIEIIPGAITTILFFDPKIMIPIEYKLLIVSLIIIMYLCYKIYRKNTIIREQGEKNLDLQKRLAEKENMHTELSKLFDIRIKTIDRLKSVVKNHNHVLDMLEYFLVAVLSTKEENKETIRAFLNIILQYKKDMEDDKYE